MAPPASTLSIKSLAGNNSKGALLICNSQGSRQLQVADNTKMEVLLQPCKKLTCFLISLTIDSG